MRQSKWLAGIVSITLVGVGFVQICGAADSAPATQPSTQPSISTDAQLLLNQIHDAYAAVKFLKVSGTLKADLNIDGQTLNDSIDFNGTVSADGRFRNELKNEMMLGNTGKQQFIFAPKSNQYVVFDAPTTKPTLDSLDKTVTSKLQSQNLSLWLALASDAGTALVADSKEVAKVADNNIDSIAYPSILISQEDADLTIIIDPKTHLIRREIIDIAKRAKTLGAQDIKSSTYTADFVNTSVDSVDDSTFAWAPPPGSQMIQSQGAEGDASALEGKAAPAFELSKLDGQKVSSKDLKGTVYILDFWATWCGPCVASMPALNETYEKYKDKGLHVFACDQAEDKATVAKFAESNKLTLTVLLDSDSKVGQSYGANAIPETVLIGKDGKVRKVFVGYGDGQEDNIRKAIDEAMAQN